VTGTSGTPDVGTAVTSDSRTHVATMTDPTSLAKSNPRSGRVPNRARTFGLVCAIVVLIVDQLTKSLVVANLNVADEVKLVGPLRIVKRFNTGMAFSQGSGSRWVGWVVTAVIVMLVVWVLRTLWRRPGTPAAVSPGFGAALGALLGGALGNKVDRLFRSGGAVVDFVDVGFWPVFNVADAALSMACIALIVLSFRNDRASKASEKRTS
jgi:signal peptidase II